MDLTFFDRSRDVAMATNFSVKIGQIELFTFIRNTAGHSETDCNIAILNFKVSSVMMWLHCL